jgi:hypothetical protein
MISALWAYVFHMKEDSSARCLFCGAIKPRARMVRDGFDYYCNHEEFEAEKYESQIYHM